MFHHQIYGKTLGKHQFPCSQYTPGFPNNNSVLLQRGTINHSYGYNPLLRRWHTDGSHVPWFKKCKKEPETNQIWLKLCLYLKNTSKMCLSLIFIKHGCTWDIQINGNYYTHVFGSILSCKNNFFLNKKVLPICNICNIVSLSLVMCVLLSGRNLGTIRSPVLISAVLKCRVTYTNLAKWQKLLNKYCNLKPYQDLESTENM